MAISVELHKLHEPQFSPGTSAWDISDKIARYLQNKYYGFILQDGEIVYSDFTNDKEMEKDTLEDVLKHAFALKHAIQPSDVHLHTNVPITVVGDDNRATLLHNYDYVANPDLFSIAHSTNIESYATLHRNDPRLSNTAMLESINGNERMDQSKPIDYYRNSVPRFSGDLDNELTKLAFKRMKEGQSLQVSQAEASGLPAGNLAKKHEFEHRLFSFQLREHRAGRFSPNGEVTIEQLQHDPSSNRLTDAFKDFAAAQLGESFRHTLKDGATELLTETAFVANSSSKFRYTDSPMQLSPANKAVVERQAAKEEAQKAQALADKQAREQAAKLASVNEHNAVFTADHMWAMLDENRRLDKSQVRDFFEHTHNHDTRSRFMSSHAQMTAGEYRRAMTTDNRDQFADEQIFLTNDLAYREMKEAHKHQLHNTHAENRPTVEAQIAFEEALFSYREDQSKGLKPNNQALLDKFVTFQELSHNRKVERFSDLVHDTTTAVQAKMVQHKAPSKGIEPKTGITSSVLEKSNVRKNILAMRQAYH